MSSFPLGFISQGGGAGSGADFELISTVTVGSATPTISFASISQAYKHLEFRIVARSSNASQVDNLAFQLNGDGSSLYSTHSLYAYNTTPTSNSFINNTYGYWPSQLIANSNTSNTFSTGTMQIIDYSSTSKNKTVRSLFGAASTTTSNSIVSLQSSLYRSTNAVTSISFVNSGNFMVGSRISLYGMRG